MKNSKRFWQFFYDTRDKISFTSTQAKDKHNFCEWEMENKMKWKGKNVLSKRILRWKKQES